MRQRPVLMVVAGLSVFLQAARPGFPEEKDELLTEVEERERIQQLGLSDTDVKLARRFREEVGLLSVRRTRVLKHLLMTDEELWDWLPHAVNGTTLPRIAPGHDYKRGCPIHGVFSGDERLGWRWTPDRPYKVQCATGGEWLPTNDYGAYVKAGMMERLDCRKEYVDDGFGCIVNGRPYWCAAAANYYIYSYIIQLRTDLTTCWKQGGSEAFLHRAMIVWASIAKDYPLMDYEHQNVGAHPSWWWGKMTQFGEDDPRLSDYFNDRKMWDVVAKDEKLKTFLKSKGIDGDLKKFIFTKIMMEMVAACRKDWFLSQGAGGERYQYIVKHWDNEDPALGPTNEVMAKQADGALFRNFYNNIYRDGINTEVAASYGLMSQNQVAEILTARIKAGKPFPRTPRLRNILCGSVRLILIDTFLPNIGDSPFTEYNPYRLQGSAITGALAKGGKGTGEPPGLILGFDLFQDPTVGKWLYQIGQRSEPVLRLVEKEGDDIALGSRVLSGYGFGVLESGERGNRRAVTLFWGPEGCGSHAHSDMLNIEFLAFGKTLAPDLGYPEETGIQPKRVAWVSQTISHSTVVVDRTSSRRVLGTLRSFKSFPGIHTLDVSAEQSAFGAAPGPDHVFRRQLTLVDLDKDRFYVVDVFRVRGGTQHDWVFHGNHQEKAAPEGGPKPAMPDATQNAEENTDEDGKPGKEEKDAEKERLPADFARRVPVQTTGLHLSDPRKWKRLSEYQENEKKAFRGTEYLHYPQFAHPVDPWSIVWDTGDDVKVRLTMLAGCCQEVILCDGEPAYRPGAPKFLKYVLARSEGQYLASNYVGFLEAYREEPTIGSVADLRGKDDGWSDVAVRVVTSDRTDYVLSSLDTGKIHQYKPDLRFRGAQAFVSEAGGAIRSACLIGSDRAPNPPPMLEGFGLAIEIADALCGTVDAIDPDAGSFDADDVPAHGGLLGETMVIGNAAHRCAYRVTGVRNIDGRRCRVQLEADMVVGAAPMKALRGQTVALAERITTCNGQFAGMTLSNEDGTSVWKIVASDMNSVTVTEGAPLADERIQDTDGDTERCVKICDFGPGDTWSVPVSVHLVREGDGYIVRSNTAARIVLPKGASLRTARSSGPAATQSGSSSSDGRNLFEVRPEELK